MLFKVKISARVATTPQGAPTNTGQSYGSFHSSFRTKFLVLKKKKMILSKVCGHVFVCGFFLLEKAAWKWINPEVQWLPFPRKDEEDVQAFPEAAPTPELGSPCAESSGCSGAPLGSSPLPSPRLWDSWEITVSLS